MKYNSEEKKVIAFVSIVGIFVFIISLPGVCIRYAFLKGKVPFKKLLTDEKNYNEFIGTFFFIVLIIIGFIFIN